ncbi:hypothetical protein HPB47_012284 [Ixodes persulcatus]|uniref:Uncharacterized protein n=1 Tax=Ixodes persulcatus TaxID=34615 RepID=A0AC60NTX7_IXOPE|nr:hypothetical protein HPB47_012284 [Ixodes persulcatus]
MSRVPIEERHHIVVLCKEGVSQREIAGRTRRPLSTVNRIIQAYRDENRLADAVRAPRSRVTDENDDLRIVGAASDDAFQSSSEIRKELGLLVSTKTIQRRLREAGLHSHIAAQKPLLTARHKQQRLEFAQDHEAWESRWDQVAFSDESTFSTRWDQQKRVWRPCHTRHNPEYVQHVAASGRCAVNVWGVLTRQGLVAAEATEDGAGSSEGGPQLGEVGSNGTQPDNWDDGLLDDTPQEESAVDAAEIVACCFESLQHVILPISNISKAEFVINEVPAPDRFSASGVAGIWFGAKHPDMSLFVGKFVEHLSSVDPIIWEAKSQMVSSKVYAVCCCLDAPARAALQNQVQFNGYFGCPWCMVTGEHLEGAMRFPEAHQIKERTHELVLRDMKYAVTYETTVNGFTGPSPLINLENHDMVSGQACEYMHSVLLSVTKQLTEHLLDSSNTAERFYIDPESKEVKLRLLLLPPHLENRRDAEALEPFGTMRSIVREKWKCEGMEDMDTLNREVQPTLRDDVTVSKIPHLLTIYGCQSLQLIPGRPPLCLRCNRVGHIRRHCQTPRCTECQRYGHSLVDCVLTYADRLRIGTADDSTTEHLMDASEVVEQSGDIPMMTKPPGSTSQPPPTEPTLPEGALPSPDGSRHREVGDSPGQIVTRFRSVERRKKVAEGSILNSPSGARETSNGRWYNRWPEEVGLE